MPSTERADRAETCADHRHSLRNRLAIAVLFVVAVALCIAFFDQPFDDLTEPLEAMPLIAALALLGAEMGNTEIGSVLALLVIVLSWRRWRRAALTIVCGVVVQALSTDLLKWLIGRPRPCDYDNPALTPPPPGFYGPGHDFNSCPSGHAAFGFMLATVAAAYFPRWRWPAYAVAIFIASGRLMLDRHYLSDVLLGSALGYLIAYLLLRLWPPQHPA
jgi:membrane-associated phospholipid phosphatase